MSFIKKYVFYIFAITLFAVISVYKFFPNILSLKKSQEKSIPSIDTSPSYIYIDLSGAVATPGVYKMPSTSRVGDLIAKGGGFTNNAAVIWISKNLNLSQLLYDTQKIYVPYEWELVESCSCISNSLEVTLPDVKLNNTVIEKSEDTEDENNSEDTIDVNTATLEELDTLKGIGPANAQKIIDNRPYTNYTDLVDRSGVSQSTLDKIEGNISF